MPCPFRVGDTLVGIHVPGHTDYAITGPGCVVEVRKVYGTDPFEYDCAVLMDVEVVDEQSAPKGAVFTVEPQYFERLYDPVPDEDFEKFLCMEVLPT